MNLKHFLRGLLVLTLFFLSLNGWGQTYNVTNFVTGLSSARGIAVDGSGNVYLGDESSNRISRITPAGVVTTLSGSTYGFAEGTGTAAQFGNPDGVTVDASGNVYVADRTNNRIRKITSAGVVTTLAGSATSGFTNATGSFARFSSPRDVAVDASGNVYVADFSNRAIRKITPSGVVTTLAGSSSAGFLDGTGTAARFNGPTALAVDASGNVYVADQNNHRIRKITPAGVVTTLAGSGTAGFADGNGTSASFNFPSGIDVDGSGNLYVSDVGNNRIRRITPAGAVSTIAGTGTSGQANGIATSATFSGIVGIAIDASGNIYVGDGSRIRKLTPCFTPSTPTISGSNTFCTGGSTVLTSSAANNYLWSNGATTQSITVSTAGTYSVRAVTGICTSATSNVISVSQTALPSTPTISGSNSFCAGSSTLLTSSSATGNLWSNGATTQSITVSTAGNYSVRVISSGCTSATSNVISVSQTTLPSTPTISGASTIDFGGSTTLTSSSSTGNIWSNGATTQSITVSTPGIYSVRVNSGGCTSLVSNTISVDYNYYVSTFATGFSSARGVAADGSGNIYISDESSNLIRKITPDGVVTTLAGSTFGNANGVGRAAQFGNPDGVTVDASGNVYVADRTNNRIRKITPAGVVTTLAATAGTFNSPRDVAVDASGNVYVADFNNHNIKRVTPGGLVSNFAGFMQGYLDGTAPMAQFNRPTALTIDAAGNLYVADQSNHRIRKITPAGVVTTLAGSGTAGFADGNGTSASFNSPSGIDIDGAGNLYVSDNGNLRIRKVTPTGVVTTIAGTGTQSQTDGIATSATFFLPVGIATDGLGNIYVGDANRVRKISPCNPPPTPTISGASTINFGGSTTLTSSSSTGNIWSNGATTQSITVSTSGIYSVRVISGGCTSSASNAITVDFNVLGYNVSTFATGFSSARGVAADGSGNIYISDESSNLIRKITPNGVVATLAGSTYGNSNGIGTNAQFGNPDGVTVDASGNVYVADRTNNRIRKITPQGSVTTLAVPTVDNYFAGPRDVAVDASGNVYFVDYDSDNIQKVTPGGVVSRFVGAIRGNQDGYLPRFNGPTALTIDAAGNIYVADKNNHSIRKITPLGFVTTLAGSGTAGFADGNSTSASFNSPSGIEIDGAGNLYVTDNGNLRIRKVTPTGVVTTIAGTGTQSQIDGIATSATFFLPVGVATDGFGNIYVGDANRVRKISPCNPPTTPTISGSNTFCAGGSTILTSSSATGNLWNNGETTQSITVNAAGNYSVRAINGACTSAISNVISVSQTALPNTPTISGNNSFCAGSSTVLTSSSASGNLWSNGATTQSITVNDAGSYSVRVISSGCTSATSNVILVSQIALPNTPSVTGINTFCAGGSTMLTSSSASGNLWSNGATTQSITVTTAGNYSVRVTANGCTSEVSNEVAVSINSLPATPVITSSNGTSLCVGESTVLSAPLATSYLWSNGATTQTINVNGAGTFTVRVTNENSCLSLLSSPTIISTQICTQVFTGVGSFNQAGRWNPGVVPNTGTDIIVEGALAITSSISLRNISVEAGGSISIPIGVTLTVTGNLSNLGTISGEGIIRLAGSNNQNFGGGTISNLTADNGATIIQNAPTQVTGTLTIEQDVTLNLNNLGLTLVSTASGTARIAPIPATARITNASNFTQQRWLDRNNVRRTPTNNGNYFSLGTVVQGQNVNLWNAVSPYANSTFVPGGIGNLYLFNTATNAWVKPTSASQTITPGTGIRVWFGINNFFANNRNHWSATGNPVVGDYNFPLSSQSGFQFLANPYPSTIDWDSPAWGNVTGIANAVYIYDWVNQRYRTYVNGIGTNGGSRYLPTAQGFMVNATASNPVLTATENIKVSNQIAMQRIESNVAGLIRMQLTSGTVTDEMVIANRLTATQAFEANQDAQKLMNPTTNIYVGGSLNQGIASMNLNEVNAIPFILQTNTNGLVYLTTTELSNVEGYTFNLFDEQTGELLPYTGSETYTFNVSANQPYRLQLRVGSVTGINTFKATAFEVYPNPATDKVTIRTTGTGSLEIVNVVGQVVMTQPATEINEINVSKLAKGVYTVKFNGASQKLVVK